MVVVLMQGKEGEGRELGKTDVELRERSSPIWMFYSTFEGSGPNVSCSKRHEVTEAIHTYYECMSVMREPDAWIPRTRIGAAQSRAAYIGTCIAQQPMTRTGLSRKVIRRRTYRVAQRRVQKKGIGRKLSVITSVFPQSLTTRHQDQSINTRPSASTKAYQDFQGICCSVCVRSSRD